MFRVRIENTDIKDTVTRVLKRQLPRGIANGINRALGDVKKNTGKQIRRRFHRPVPYMERVALFQSKATPWRLMGKTGIKDHQASKYLFQEKGGWRTARSAPGKFRGQRGSAGGKMIPIPTGIRLDAYGNMTPRAIKGALRRRDTFQAGDREGVSPGVYRRKRGSDKLETLVVFKKKTRYRPIFRWQDAALKTVQARAAFHFKATIGHELRNPVFRTRRGQKRF